MSKQEEIRDGVITNIVKACPNMLNENVAMLADKIIKDEKSQGLVIKVGTRHTLSSSPITYDITEPLIKEVTNG